MKTKGNESRRGVSLCFFRQYRPGKNAVLTPTPAITLKWLSQFYRNLVAQVSRLEGTRSIPASFAQAQRLGVRVLLQLAGWEACVTPLRLAPVRALPAPGRRCSPAAAGKIPARQCSY